MRTLPFRLALAASLLALSPIALAVRLPAVLSDHAVLLRAAAVPVWGWATPREQVTIELGDQKATVQADANGRWRARLDTTKLPGTPLKLAARGKFHTLVVDDVLVGEVWLASGQSNMEKPLGDQKGWHPADNYRQEIAAANYPQLRLFKVAKQRAPAPADDVKGSWVVCTPEAVEATMFSAVGYYFGRNLQQALHKPVGVLDASYGGTRIEAWTPAGGTVAQAAAGRERADDGTPPPADGNLYNAMIAPLAPYALRGVLWYQAESNVSSSETIAAYTGKMESLVQGWRKAWDADLPFYYVQIAPHAYSSVRKARVASPYALPEMWEAQADALRIPRTAMVVTTDLVDNLRDIHPRDKTQVGQRLANLALAYTYGHTGTLVDSPAYRAIAIEGGNAVISFEHADGLKTRDGAAPTHFEIAGADGVYQPASASVRGDKVVLSSPAVPAPVAARFAWTETAQPNLVNRAGLPAAPFRTQRDVARAAGAQ